MSALSVVLAAALCAAPQLEGPESVGTEGMRSSAGPTSLGEVLKDKEFFDITNPAAVKASRAPARNPFLLPEEQKMGRSLEELLLDKREEERRLAAEEALLSKGVGTATPIDHARALLEDYLRSIALTAVLISDEIQTAVINGELIDRGEILPGTAFVLSDVRRDGVRLAVGDHHFDVRLPPPGRAKPQAKDQDDTSEAESKEQQAEGAVDAAKDSPIVLQEGG